MGRFSTEGDWENFNTTHDKFNADLLVWRSNVVPLYTYGKALTTFLYVKLWDGGRYAVEEMHGYDITVMVSYRAEKVLADARVLFGTGNRTRGYLDPNVRFFIDNSDALTKYYMNTRMQEIEDTFFTPSSRLKILQIVLTCASCLVIVVAGLVYPYVEVRMFIRR
jgi:hypothetical protein